MTARRKGSTPEFLLAVIAETWPGASAGARWRRIAGARAIVIAPSSPAAPIWPELTPSAATKTGAPAPHTSPVEGTVNPYAGSSRTVTGQAESQLHHADHRFEDAVDKSEGSTPGFTAPSAASPGSGPGPPHAHDSQWSSAIRGGDTGSPVHRDATSRHHASEPAGGDSASAAASPPAASRPPESQPSAAPSEHPQTPSSARSTPPRSPARARPATRQPGLGRGEHGGPLPPTADGGGADVPAPRPHPQAVARPTGPEDNRLAASRRPADWDAPPERAGFTREEDVVPSVYIGHLDVIMTAPSPEQAGATGHTADPLATALGARDDDMARGLESRRYLRRV